MKTITNVKKCPLCNSTTRQFTKNGYMVLKSLPVEIQKIPKLKCKDCEGSFYDKSIQKVREHNYHTAVKRIALHLYIEGYSIEEIYKYMRNEGFRVVLDNITKFLEPYQTILAEVRPMKKRVRYTKDSSKFQKRDAYTFSLLIQERDEYIISDLLRGFHEYIKCVKYATKTKPDF